MQLSSIQLIQGQIRLLTGLHIGAGNEEMHIGGTDDPVIKNPITQLPYIPGSSLKGKMRSLLEWHLGVVSYTNGAPLSYKHLASLPNPEQAKILLKLFGGSADTKNDETLIRQIGPTRLAFWDCNFTPAFADKLDTRSLMPTETKMENTINRIQGTAEHPRQSERVPAGAEFDFKLTLKVHDHEDLTPLLLQGFKLLTLTGLGGSVSRGYGKIEFLNLTLGTRDLSTELKQLTFAQAA